MKQALKSTFNGLAKWMRGSPPPKQNGIMSNDLKGINDAANSGDVKEMSRYLDKYDVGQLLGVTRSIETGWSFLHHAAMKGHVGIIALLLDAGASVQDADNWGATPLHVAAACGQKAVAELLLKRSAKLDGQDNLGWTPLASAARNGRLELAEFLMDKGADISPSGFSPLWVALGHPAIMTSMIDRGAALDTAGDGGMTALMMLCANRDIPEREACAQVLLSREARTDLISSDGRTARTIALENGYEAVAALIEKAEAARAANRLRLTGDITVRRIRLKKPDPSA